MCIKKCFIQNTIRWENLHLADLRIILLPKELSAKSAEGSPGEVPGEAGAALLLDVLGLKTNRERCGWKI